MFSLQQHAPKPLFIKDKINISALFPQGVNHEFDVDRDQAPAPNFLLQFKIKAFNYFLPVTGDIARPYHHRHSPAFLHRSARNLLRYLVLGTEVKQDPHYAQCLAAIEKGLTDKIDSGLLSALLTETQRLLINLNRLLNDPQLYLTPANELKITILISNLMSLLPFFAPNDKATIQIPQKINGSWSLITYQFNQLDISPHEGLLASLLEPMDRLYAYGLTPVFNSTAQNHLLLMGTTYPTGQGEGLSDLYNWKPLNSLGEGHDFQAITNWLNTKSAKKTDCHGHSKGGTMAMIAAAQYPLKIQMAHCLNPAALSAATLKRLKSHWNDADHPVINIYAQEGDPVFTLERGFLTGSNIYRISAPNNPLSRYKPFVPKFFQRWMDSHLQHFVGHAHIHMTHETEMAENRALGREFKADMKQALNWVLFPSKYLQLCFNIFDRKADRFFENHAAVGGIDVTRPLRKTLLLAINVIKAVIVGVSLIPALLMTGIFSGMKVGFKTLFLKKDHSDNASFSDTMPLLNPPKPRHQSLLKQSPYLLNTKNKLGYSVNSFQNSTTEQWHQLDKEETVVARRPHR